MPVDQNAGGSCFPRLVWLIFGPMILLALTVIIAERRGGWFGPASLGFLIVLGVTVLARWLDFRSGHGKTAEGKPATIAHFRRYVLTMLSVGVIVWFVANLIGAR